MREHRRQLESGSVHLPHIVAGGALVQVLDEVEELDVVGVLLEGGDRDAVGELCSEGVDCVVYKQHVLQGNVPEDAQVFDVLAVGGPHARRSVEPVLNELPSGVEVVQDGVCVQRSARSEHAHLVVLVGGLEQLLAERPNVEPGSDRSTRWSRQVQEDVRFPVGVRLLHAMGQRFVQIKQEQLPDMWLRPLYIYPLLFYLLKRYFQLLQEVNGLVDVDRELHVDWTLQRFSFLFKGRFLVPDLLAVSASTGNGALTVLLARVVCHVDLR